MAAGPRRRMLVLGNGGFGTALAIVLRDAGHEVRVWGHEDAYSAEIERTRRNPKFLPDVEIPSGIRFGHEASELAPGAEAVFSVVPTQFLRLALDRVLPSLPLDALFVSCSKGFERSSLALPSDVLRGKLPGGATIGVLSGPSHAEEVARRLPTAVVVAAFHEGVARRIQELVTTPVFRAYRSDDPRGVEVAAAAKNVIAIAAGISDGLGFGDDARAALVCRGATEISRLGEALGARPETFAGLSGIGDLVVTCTSRHSRNRSVGWRIGRGESLGDIVASSEKIAEGIETARALARLSGDLDVELPIAAEVHAVLFEGKPPRDAVTDLMTRAPTRES